MILYTGLGMAATGMLLISLGAGEHGFKSSYLFILGPALLIMGNKHRWSFRWFYLPNIQCITLRRHCCHFCVDSHPCTHSGLPKVPFVDFLVLLNIKIIDSFQIWPPLPTLLLDLQEERRPSFQSILQTVGNLSQLSGSICQRKGISIAAIFF